MSYLKLKTTSKNKESIKDFFYYIFDENCSYIEQDFYCLKKNYKTKLNKRRFTLLKAPHINKIAQEQFEHRIFSTTFYIYVFNKVKFFNFLKEIKKNEFSDIKIKITLINKQNLKNLYSNNYLLNNFFAPKSKYFKFKNTLKVLKIFKRYSFLENYYLYGRNFVSNKIKKKEKRKITNYLNYFDMFGEFVFKTLCLDSSVGRAKD